MTTPTVSLQGYACTSSAPEGEGGGGRLVLDLLEPWMARFRKEHPRGTLPPRLFSVGRLDVASVGLLFVTNDGGLRPGRPDRMSHADRAAAHCQGAVPGS